MRVMGLDYGTKTVGVAISDEEGIIAQPLVTIERKHADKLRQTYAQIESILTEYPCERSVVGLPKNMNSTEGERAEASRLFAENVERRTGLTVELEDERLTTMEADRILAASDVIKSKRKTYIDKMAAAIILQSYLDRENNKRNL